MRLQKAQAVLTAGLCLACAKSYGQVNTATVSGVIEDASGARLPHAQITLMNLQNGTINSSASTADGAFLVPAVIPGNYSLQVSRDGFATLRLLGLTLSIGELRRFQVVLQVSSSTQTIDVVSDRSAFSLQGAEISSVVAQHLVNNLPLAGRSFQDLVAMTPGAVLQTPQVARAGGFSINGQPTDTNQYLVDGVSANFSAGPLDTMIKTPAAGQYATLTTLGTTQGILALDALQEFRVISSGAQAEYGRSPGGQFSLLSQQGTDNIHATAYAALRNGYFDAQDRFGSNTAYYHQQDVGGTVTMPLDFWRRAQSTPRTLAFGTYEELHVEQRLPFLDLYGPSSSLKGAAPLQIERVLGAFPDPQFYNPDMAPLVSSYLPDAPSPSSFLRSMDFRVDRTFREHFHLFGRFGEHPSGSTAQLLNTETVTRATSSSFTAGLDAQLSPHFGNESRFGWALATATSQSNNFQGRNGNRTTANDIGSSLGVPTPLAGTRSEVFIRVDGIGQTSAFSDGADSRVRQLQLRSTFSWQKSSHLLRYGVDFRGLHSSITPREYSVEADYLDAGSLLRNQASYAVLRHALPAYPVFRQRAAFLQDAWQVRPRLTLSYGLRWDVAPPPTVSEGILPVTLQYAAADSSTLSFRRVGAPLWRADWANLGPRAGASWQVNNRGAHSLVLHAGAGILFDNAHRAAAEMFRGAGFVATRVVTQAALPLTAAFLPVVNPDGLPDSRSLGYLLPGVLRSPWTLQWNFLAEQALGEHQTVSGAFVGASGHRLLVPMRHVSTQVGAPTAGDVTFPTGYTDAYSSLQLQWRGSKKQVTWMTSYVLAQAMDSDSVQPYTPATYATAATDVRHNLQAAVAWDLPRATGSTFLRRSTEGWGLDARYFARSAYPVTPTGALLVDPVTGERLYRNVSLDPIQPLYINDQNAPGGRILNGGPGHLTGAFRLPDPGTEGNAPRNLARGFGAQQLSFSFRREIGLFSQVKLLLRGDVFNATNTPDFGYIDPQLTDRLFGSPLLSLNQSYGQTSSLYQPGGPRSLQWTFRVRW